MLTKKAVLIFGAILDSFLLLLMWEGLHAIGGMDDEVAQGFLIVAMLANYFAIAFLTLGLGIGTFQIIKPIWDNSQEK